MGTPTGTLVKGTELAGQYKIVCLTCIPVSAADTITLTLATHGITAITAILGCEIQTGQDADFQTVHATFSGLVITLVSLNAAGGASTNWDTAVVRLTVLGTQ